MQTFRVDVIHALYGEGHTLINAETAKEALAAADEQNRLDGEDKYATHTGVVVPATQDDLWPGAEAWRDGEFEAVIIAE